MFKKRLLENIIIKLLYGNVVKFRKADKQRNIREMLFISIFIIHV